MKYTAFLGLGCAAFMAASSPALSIMPAATQYLLTMEIHDGDRVVGTPKLMIAADQPSRIEISETSGNHYNLTMTVTAQPNGTAFVKSTIDVMSGGVHQALSPSLLVALSKPSAIAFGADSATSKPIRVDFTLNKLG